MQQRLLAALGERRGRLAGAVAAGLADPRAALGGRAAASGCLETLALCADDGPELAARALLVAQRGDAEARSVGRVCLRLARARDLAGIRALLACVDKPDELCCGALLNCLAELGQVDEALAAAERMHAEGLGLSFASFRHLVDRTESSPVQLRVFERARALCAQLDTTAYNRWMRALLRYGRWQAALDLLPAVKEPDVVTYVTLVSGLSDMDRPAEALRVALAMMNNPRIVANEISFSALRSLCRTHGLERQWPAMRSWHVQHGVRVGPVNSSWREFDSVSKDPARLLFPR